MSGNNRSSLSHKSFAGNNSKHQLKVSRFYDKAKINNNNSRQTKLTEFGFEVPLRQSQKKITEFFPKEEDG
jgi:hypothetical protein